MPARTFRKILMIFGMVADPGLLDCWRDVDVRVLPPVLLSP